MQARRIVLLLLAPFLATAALGGEAALDPSAARHVIVREVALQGDAVSGVVANGSTRSVRDVQLEITYAWLWTDERHPGSDNPGRTDRYTLQGDIPVAGAAPFTYRPSSPLPRRRDGHFAASASVVGFTEVIPPEQ